MPLYRKLTLRTSGTGFIAALLVLWCSLGGCCSVDRSDRSFVPTSEDGGGSADLKDTDVDLESRPLAPIPPGTVIGKGAPEGWTHLVLIATPTFSKEAQDQAPAMAIHYAQMLKFTLLARTRKVGTAYRLDSAARGFAIDIDGKETIISSAKTMGAGLGLFGSRILSGNEKHFEADVRQVARTPTMLMFDAQATMRQGTEHVKMVVRHAIVVNPATGKLGTFVWLLSRTRTDYALADKAMQLLPDSMHEARMLAISRDKFSFGLPTPEAFALVRIPQGTSVAYTRELEKLAAVKDFKREQVVALEKALRAIAAEKK